MATTILKCLAEGQGIIIGKENGELNTIDSALPIYLQSTNLTNNVIVNSDLSGDTMLEFTDIGNTRIGAIQPRFLANGNQTIRFFTQRLIEDTNYYNGFYLELDQDGNSIVELMGNNTKKAWHTALKPDILFTGDSSTVPITLSASAANYTHMKIFYESKIGGTTPLYRSACVYEPNGKYVNLFVGEAGAGGNDRYPWWKGWDIWIDGNTIKDRPTNRYYDTSSSNKTTRTTIKSKNMYITRVEAW